MLVGYVHALLLVGANAHQLIDVNERTTTLQRAEVKGQPTTAELFRQHAAPSQSAVASPVTPPASGEPEVSSPASLPVDHVEILESGARGELQKMVKRLDKFLGMGGSLDALYSIPNPDGQTAATGLLHVAATNGHLEIVRVLLKRGASIDLPDSLGRTALMEAASYGRLSVLLVLLQHSANPDLQTDKGRTTALTRATDKGQEACVKALLRAKANTELFDVQGRTALDVAEMKGYTAIAELIRQHAAPPQPAAAEPAAPPDAAGELAVSSLVSLPAKIFVSAERGELQTVVKWLREGGPVDALCSSTTRDRRVSTFALLHAAASYGHLEMLRELLKRGASVDLQTSLGATALMDAASYGHLSVLLVLLQHSRNPDLQNINGHTALMRAAAGGHEACVKALLRAEANTELLEIKGRTALDWAEMKGYTAIAELLRQHAPGVGVALCAVPWVALSVVLGALATVAFSRTFTARRGQHRAAQQRRPHRTARHAKAQGPTTTEEPIRQHAAPQQPAAAVALHPLRAEQAAQAWVDGAIEEPLVKEAAEQAEGQARSKKSKKKKASRTAAVGDEPSEGSAPPAPAPSPTAAPKPAASAAERAEVALRAAIAGGGLSALEAALTAAPHKVRDGGVGVDARARCNTLLEAQQEAEREAKQEAAAEAARLAAGQVREAAAWAAAATAREEAVAAVAKADALERAIVEGGEGGAVVPSEASEAAKVPDDYICPITADIMTDPVSTMDGFTYERTAISEWLQTNDTSPVTGAELDSKALVPNLSLRSMIRSFAQEFDAGEFARD